MEIPALPPVVLVVDDDPVVCRMLAAQLAGWGYAVRIAEGGVAGVDLAREILPAVILLDVEMPGLDGIAACRALRSFDETRRIPIVHVTGATEADVKIRCLDAGASDFIAKPVDPVELHARIRNLLVFGKYDAAVLRNRELAAARDLLEKANHELRSAQAQVVQQEKMASIGLVAAGIAHEINNPAGFIMSNLGTFGKYAEKLTDFIQVMDAALKEADPALRSEVARQRKALKVDFILEDIHRMVAESLEGTDRIRRIVQDLKSFSRLDTDGHQPADLNAVLDSTLNIIWHELKYTVTLKKDYGTLPPTRCNAGQLAQVFMNLLVNAGHAIGTQGEITIVTREEADGWIRVSISDNGCGIPEEKRAKIFEPFFTTKEVGKGTGLGLSIALDIVKKHGGGIGIESVVGQGTTFEIRLPVVA